MKKTALEWLEERFEKFLAYYEGHHKAEMYSIHQLSNDFDQAKEMEEGQQGYSEEDLEKAFKVGFTLGYVGDTLIADKDKCFNRWFKIFKNK